VHKSHDTGSAKHVVKARW